MEDAMGIEMRPIGYVSTEAVNIPRSCTISEVEGDLVMDETYLEALRDIKPGGRLYVLFHFDRSPAFSSRFLRITPPHRDHELGVFSTHSPYRPNPIGLSIVDVLGVERNVIHVKGVDMLDRTPILDIKPEFCP
jgi:tRNA-Thr(GGU) m(6)t(6)A37 methyltransferase TsaA